MIEIATRTKSAAISNRYFSALPEGLRQKWEPHTRWVAVQLRQRLKLDTHESNAYFPIDCIAAQFIKGDDGARRLSRLHGRDMTVGLSVELIAGRVDYDHAWIYPGTAIEVPRQLILSSVSPIELKKGQADFLSYASDLVALRANCQAQHSLSHRLSCVLLQLIDLGWTSDSRTIPPGVFERLTGGESDALLAVHRVWQKEGILHDFRMSPKMPLVASLQKIVCDCYEKQKVIDNAMFESWCAIKWAT
jgi:hypothetical protein